ncbi:tubulin-tyrosine ligase family protein (macronuclear) [Tetrahymena thermophila SB210]|uniref:Tubulin-tyrosine ligase family protein n=1 Tax=Tetrahymena thermophila (strain SB210) TaxID=312017 RepID=I7LT89_TETTS|nr:tubulin-tyrosine ligase family protein [Tetrahymena thermophila SB210]EAR84806.2 tubulin-tyrosine ligase family protein [Tetrahymena thermophila SB210]|eukprot:XP_001032469.2 tubulin-tyrosine ligase family protein [Tetrahymena thermophila SB210]
MSFQEVKNKLISINSSQIFIFVQIRYKKQEKNELFVTKYLSIYCIYKNLIECCQQKGILQQILSPISINKYFIMINSPIQLSKQNKATQYLFITLKIQLKSRIIAELKELDRLEFKKIKSQGDEKSYLMIDKNEQSIKLDIQFNSNVQASKSSVIVFLFDLTSKMSFDNAKRIYQSIKTIINQNKCIIFLLGNKLDMSCSRQIHSSDANAFAQKNNMIYLEISCTVPMKINEFLKLLQQKVIIQKEVKSNPQQQTSTQNQKKSVILDARDIFQQNILNMCDMGKSQTLQTVKPQLVATKKVEEVISIESSVQNSARDKWQTLQNIVTEIQEDEKKYTEQLEKCQFQQQVLNQQYNFHQAALQQKQKDLTDFLLYINRQHNENQIKLQNKSRIFVKDILCNIDQIKQWNNLIHLNVSDKYQIDSFIQLTSQMMQENIFQLLQIIISKDVLPQTKISNNQNDIQKVVNHLLLNQSLLQDKITADGYQKVQLFNIFLENFQSNQIQLSQFEFGKTSNFGLNPLINQSLQNNGQILQQQNLETSIENNMNQVNEQTFQFQKQLELQSSVSQTHQQSSKAQISTKSQTPQSYKQNKIQKFEFSPILLKHKKFVEYFKTPTKRNQIQIEDQQMDQEIQQQQRSLTPSYSSKTGYYNNKSQVKQPYVQKSALTDQKRYDYQQKTQYFNNSQFQKNLTPQKKQTLLSVKQQKVQNQSQIKQQIEQSDFIFDCEYLRQYYSFLRKLNNQNNLVQNFDMLRFLDYNPVINLQMQINDSLYDQALSMRWWWIIQNKSNKLQNQNANLFCSQELSLDYFSYLTPLKLFQKQNLQKEDFDDSYLISNVSSLVSYKTNQFKTNDQDYFKQEELKIQNIFKKSQQNQITALQEEKHVANPQKWYHINNKKSITLYNHLQPFQEIEKQYVDFQAQNQDILCIPTSFLFTKENFKQQAQKFQQEFDKLDGSINQIYLDQSHQKDISQNFLTNTWIVKIIDNKNDNYDYKIIYKKEDIQQFKNQLLQPKQKIQKIIVQKYIEQPLLLEKRKFTIKGFVLVTSYNDHLNAYWYEDGFISTCSKSYQILDLDDDASHNTNDQKQFKAQNYGIFEKFNKMSLSEYKDAHFQFQNCSFDNTILQQIKKLSSEFIKYKAQDILNDRLQFCFQVISLNFIVDKYLKVWLLSVNTKLKQGNSQNQFLYKFYNELIDQTFRFAVDPLFPPPYYTKSQYDKIPKNLIQTNKYSHIYSS